MKVGDLVKHVNGGDIGIVVECDDEFYSYKIHWSRWWATGWYTPDMFVLLKKNKLFS